MKFKVGDRVTRRTDVFNPRSKLKRGMISKSYQDMSTNRGIYTELYEVTWDDGEVQKGFLPHGLDLDISRYGKKT